jgi:hypothetical protein
MAMPMIIVGLMVGSIFGLLTAVGAEMVGGSTGLGNRLTYYSSLIRIPQFFACIVLLAATGIGLYAFWSWVARRWPGCASHRAPAAAAGPVRGRLLVQCEAAVSRPSGGLVDVDHDPGAGRLGVDQSQSAGRAALLEETPATAHDDRIDPQAVLVDEVVLHQRPGEGAAAVDLELVARLLLQLGDLVRDIRRDERRVVPLGLVQRR